MIVLHKKLVRRKTIFAVGAILLGLVPFVLIECSLRIAGLGVVSGYRDPFVTFSRSFPLFQLDEETGEYQTARYHRHFFGLQRFPSGKERAAFRAFCLGGSTVLGHPYDTETAFSKWLEIELSGKDPSRRFELINCGGMSYASYRLIPILEEVLSYEPNLIVVMTGHNEFLEDRTYQDVKQRSASRVWIDDRLASLRTVTLVRRALTSLRASRADPENRTKLAPRVDTRLDHQSGYASYRRDEQWKRDVCNHFSLNLRAMVHLCRQAGVPIIFVVPGSNLRDCPPFKSENGAHLTSQQISIWNEYFQKGESVEVADPAQALRLFRRAEKIDNQHAQLIFRIARCLDRLRAVEEAREAYVLAKELDICPLRILSSMQESLIELGATMSVPVVDAARLLQAKSHDGCVGFDWYVDQVHPNIRGHQLIAQAIATKLYDLAIVSAAENAWNNRSRQRAYHDQMTTLGDKYLAAGRRRVMWLERWARRDRLRDDTIPLDARGMLDLGNSQIEFAEYEQSEIAYRMALQTRPDLADQLMDRAFQSFQSGRTSAAEKIISIIVEESSDRSILEQSSVALAALALEGGRKGEANEHAKSATVDASVSDGAINRWLRDIPEARKLFD